MIAPSRLNRRQFIGSLGIGSAAVGVGASLSGCATQPDTPTIPPDVSDDLNLRLLNRTTFGPTAREISEIEEVGYDAYLVGQLDADSIVEDALAPYLAPLWAIDRSAWDIVQSDMADEVAEQLVHARFFRAVYSRRQLFERMVEFWTDHFNVYQLQEATIVLKTVDDREVIRKHALGNFGELLHASARSGAMLVYLNNATNFTGVPNENYARELLELHTVGVDGGYTQRDVEELARALTGWSVLNEDGPELGTFVFRPEVHDFGAKQVMGLSIPAGGGIGDGNAALDYLASHASTARFIAGKLVRHFVAESAPQAVVDRVAAAFESSGGDIKTTLRALFARESLEVAEAKLKRPMHYIVDTIRRAGVRMTQETDLGEWLYVLGNIPYRWPAPNGYPDTAAYWAPGLLNRWNFATLFSYGESGSAPFDPLEIATENEAFTPSAIVELWDRLLFAGEMPDTERQNLLAYLNEDPENEARLYYESFALAASAPSFQWS